MEIKTIGIVGSGIMGAGIAEVCGSKGYSVILRSRSEQAIASMRSRIEKSLSRQVEKEKITSAAAEETLKRIVTTTELTDMKEADLIIESVVEDVHVKHKLFEELDQIINKNSILATNTSTLCVTDMAVRTSRPEKFCGLHFFNPAPAMRLVEVVRTLVVSEDTISAATRLAENLGKTPVVVEDRAGFIVNALLFPYLNNAIKLLEAGTSNREGIDEAMRLGCGFPMGPLELLDLVGLDTSLAILNALYDEFKDPNYAPSPLLKRMVSAGQLGRKSGKGFYSY